MRWLNCRRAYFRDSSSRLKAPRLKRPLEWAATALSRNMRVISGRFPRKARAIAHAIRFKINFTVFIKILCKKLEYLGLGEWCWGKITRRNSHLTHTQNTPKVVRNDYSRLCLTKRTVVTCWNLLFLIFSTYSLFSNFPCENWMGWGGPLVYEPVIVVREYRALWKKAKKRADLGEAGAELKANWSLILRHMSRYITYCNLWFAICYKYASLYVWEAL